MDMLGLESSDDEGGPDGQEPVGQVRAFDFLSDGESDPGDQAPAVVPVKLKSKRNGERRAHDGHIYVSPKVFKSDGVTFAWRCQFKDTCKGRLHTNGLNGDVIGAPGPHNHYGQQVRVESELFKEAIKRRAAETLENVDQILGAELPHIAQAVQEQGPSRDANRQLTYRVRKDEQNAPPRAKDRQSLAVPEQYAYYITADRREKFLLLDSGEGDPDRLLVFGRETLTDHLRHYKIIYIDGTFSVAPPLFAQLLVVVGRRGTFAHPLFHVLMPDRKEATYKRLFDMLLEAYPDLRPDAICLDFELALINCMKIVFPDARLSACYFHLSQVVIRHLTGGLRKAYETELEFSIHLRMILALAFVPSDKLVAYHDALKQILDARLVPVIEYFEETYIGKRKAVRVPSSRGRLKYKIVRSQPRYPHSMWQLHRRFVDGDDSTNNYVESAHRRLQRHLASNHPDVWRFIHAMHSVQRTFDFAVHQNNGGAQPRKKRCSILSRNCKIRALVEEIDHREPLGYLRSIACCLSD